MRRLLALAILLLPFLVPSPGQAQIPPSLSTQAKVSASSEEADKKNFAKRAIDGKLNTRWCAASPKTGEWIQLDFSEPKHIRSVRLHWEAEKNGYKYRIESSADGTEWRTIHDRSNEPVVESGKVLEVDAPKTRFLKVTFLGSASGSWGSIKEIEASEGKLEALPDKPLPTLADVVAPAGFKVSLYGVPPEVNYPVCITAAATGEVFVGVDEQGSLGKEPGRGKILRCRDTNGDGVADEIKVFAKVDHPRGLIYDSGSLWVLHPPTMSVYHDDNNDGIADRHETLITGISTQDVAARGADHTTNGIQIGIDGWIYIAVGDYGVTDAKGTDGTVINRRGGGIIRVRPDGKEMEIYAWGLRNVLDACVDPVMNIYTRDNTNDGGGWDVRLSQIFQSANYGYPSLYLNFKEEIMPPLADFGGGSGCGGLFLDDGRWPSKYGHALYTADWGRSEVYLHHPVVDGPTHSIDQETFLKIPRPTDVDVDGSGRMYVSSWKGGQFNYEGPNVGFVAQIVPDGLKIEPFPELKKLGKVELTSQLNAPDAKHRQHAQLEILRRGRNAETTQALVSLIKNDATTHFGKVAAIYTLKQLDGVASHPLLLELTRDPRLQAVALRALTDRKSEVANLPSEPFLAGLASTDPQVRVQAIISIGRLNRPTLAEAVLPYTVREDGQRVSSKKQNEPDPQSVIPHLAVQCLVDLNAVETCLQALNGPYRHGALAALKGMHNAETVKGLTAALASARSEQERQEILTTLIRLYHQEGVYEKNWWGTRPDRTGPYYDRQPWQQTEAIGKLVEAAYRAAPAETQKQIASQLNRHQVKLEGIADELAAMAAQSNDPITLPKVDPNNPNLIGNMPVDQAIERSLKAEGDSSKGRALFESHSCLACHTIAEGQTPKGPHLVDIGKRYSKAELIESILKPSAKVAQGFETQVFVTTQGKVYTGFVTSEGAEEIQIRGNDGVSTVLKAKDVEERNKQPLSMMPAGLVNDLTPKQLAHLVAWLSELKSAP